MTPISGDEGIDESSWKTSLVLILIYVQAKRYAEDKIRWQTRYSLSVGAITGRGGKGRCLSPLVIHGKGDYLCEEAAHHSY